MSSILSGSPTQLAASCATAADLAGLPDDAFRDGDLAYVTALGDTFQLDRDSAAVPDGTTVIATFTGNGRWLVFANFPAVSNLITTSDTIDSVVFNDAPDVYTEIMSVPAGFVPKTGVLVVRAMATFQRAGGAGTAQAKLRVRVDGVGIYAAGRVNIENAQSQGLMIESIIGAAVGVAMPAVIFEWTADTEFVQLAIPRGAEHRATLTLQDINFVP